ncbi:MAG: hypothetical protein HYU25_03700 [Candidatus Rokubacteria bacterium]|nr:hypothetical protein [Candidatus Rokubacteria bacterium]
MGDAGATAATRPRPRWRRLYAIALLAVAAFALAELAVRAPALRIALECAIAVAASGATLRWIRANRVALDLLEWCDCAAKTITVRVILSRPARPEDTCAAGALVTPVGDPSGPESEVREPSVPR